MEYRKKCNVCGKIFCYTDEDLKENASNAGMALLESIGGLASTLGGGTIFHTHHLQEQADRYSDKIVDYDQCPYCHSRDLSFITGNLYEEAAPTPVVETPIPKTVNVNPSASTEALMKRVFLFLEDGEWESADAYAEACLDKNPELAAAYLAKLMVENKVHSIDELVKSRLPISESKHYKKAIRYGDKMLISQLNAISGVVEDNIKKITEVRKRLEDPDCCVMLVELDGRVVALCADGSIQVCNNQDGAYDPQQWRNLVSIGIGYHNIIGLRDDGTVVSFGENETINSAVSGWRDISSIHIEGNNVVGLRTDGTVIACGEGEYYLCDVDNWDNIVAIDSSSDSVVGLCCDGTVKWCGEYPESYSYLPMLGDVSRINLQGTGLAVYYANGDTALVGSKIHAVWSNIKSINSMFHSKIVLRNDGTVFTWDDFLDKLEVNDWKNIVDAQMGAGHVIGLKQDGTVVATGSDKFGQCAVSGWKDIVAIKAGTNLSLGICADGTVVCCGDSPYGKVDTFGLKLFSDITDLDACIVRNRARRVLMEKAAAERKAEKERAEEERRKAHIAELQKEKQSLQAEIPNIKGIFASGKKKKLEARISDIDAELKKLNA